MPKFSIVSKSRLETCHQLLQDLFNEVIKEKDCIILCGHRGEAEQERAVSTGASKVHFPHSKHNSIPSMAVDVAPYPVHWGKPEEFDALADYVKEVADKMGIPVDWGWREKNKWDKPHYQLKLM